MKCPRCGLVHPASEAVCRRCEIDMKTGEPAARAALSAEEETESPLAGLTSLLPEPLRKLVLEPTRPETRPAKKEIPQKPGKQEGKKGKITQAGSLLQKQANRVLAFSAWRKKRAVSSISCIRCASIMTAKKQPYLTRGWPLAFSVIAAVLLVLSFEMTLLFLPPALVSALWAWFSFWSGRSFWECGVCGYIIPRR